MEIRVTVPGHMQRGGSPCPYDRVLSTRLGSEAAQLILDKQYGYMVGMVNGKVKKIPLGECAGKLKTVDPIKGEKFYELYCSVPKIPSFHL